MTDQGLTDVKQPLVVDVVKPILSESDAGVPLTVEQLKAVMPKRQKTNITQSLVDELNLIVQDPEHRESFRQNILGYADVLTDPTTTLPGYIRAVKYVSYKLMGYTNEKSWMLTHPERYQRLVDKNADPKYIRSLVCAYNKGQMVNQIREQSMIPTWVLNADTYQQAINTQMGLMTNPGVSDKVRTDAANSLLTHLKQPEATKMTLDVNVKVDESIGELREVTEQLAIAQRLAIQAGLKTPLDIAESKILEGEVIK